MPFFRVEIKQAGKWALLHGRVETKDAESAVEYVKQVLPKRTEGHDLRATPVKSSNRVTTLQPTEAYDG